MFDYIAGDAILAQFTCKQYRDWLLTFEKQE
jgi:hypothetical protein